MTSAMRPYSPSRHTLQLTPHDAWATQFWSDLTPLKEQVVHHRFFEAIATTSIGIEGLRHALMSFYPLVENFPKYMGLNLRKTYALTFPGHAEARHWLIKNLRVEQNHADWWCDWAEGFGCTRETLSHATPSPAVDAINYYLWYINTYGTLVEGIAATNIAVEWATGEWTINVIDQVESVWENRASVCHPTNHGVAECSCQV